MIRKIIFVITSLTTCVITACSDSQIANQEKIGHDWISALNKHDTTTLEKFYDDSVSIESRNWEGKKKGIAEVKSVYGRYFTSTPDLKEEIIRITATDSALVLEYTSHGTLEKLEKNIPDYMQGKSYTLENCTRMTIKNGKIVDQKTYFDQVAFLRQVGFFDQR